MKKIILKGNGYCAEIEADTNSVCLIGGYFSDMVIEKSPLFTSRIKKVGDMPDKSFYVDSCTEFEKINVSEKADSVHIEFINPENATGITYTTDIFKKCDGLEFKTSVKNVSETLSVMETTYPTPVMSHEKYDIFEPTTCGRVIKDAGAKNHISKSFSPSKSTMQFLATYSEKGGIYLGMHDKYCSQKRFEVECNGKQVSIKPWVYGVGGNTASNSYELPGVMKWQVLNGDWYDAAMIYSEFVEKEAIWTVKHDKNGRIGTHQKFKDAVMWVSDYIPNSEAQGDNKPMKLSAGSDIYDRDYWIKAPIQLQKELGGIPICYHIYNWHEIPFNINYPHFMPAKQEFIEGMRELQKHNIYVIPYINARSWEEFDGEDGYEVNFENTGCNGAHIDEDGKNHMVVYPQHKNSGKPANLVSICGSFDKWHDMMEELTREIEALGVDGIYYDQIGAVGYEPCYSDKHGHLPGDGRANSDGYRALMKRIIENKPDNMYYFTEDAPEVYIDCFDGLLGWLWIQSGDVPAHPAIYSGQVQVIGRMTMGAKKDDIDYFKYFMAKCLLYGQQIGWCKADVLYNKDKLEYLKTVVALRYKYRDIFNGGKLLRPPVVTTSEKDIITPNMVFKEAVCMEQVLAGAWTDFDKNRKIVMLVNVSDNAADITMKFKFGEYGISKTEAEKEFTINGEFAEFSGKMDGREIKVWEF